MANIIVAIGRFCRQSKFFAIFLFSSIVKNMALLLYIHTVIIAGEFSKARNNPLTYLGPWNGARCQQETFTTALLLIIAFLILCLIEDKQMELREFDCKNNAA